MYHIDYSWRNFRENTPSWLTRRNVHLGLGIIWILLLIPAFLFWKESILFVIVMSIYANVEASFAAREGASAEKEQIESRKRIEETLVKICDREEKEEESFNQILSTMQGLKEDIMALGRETQSALTELREAIAQETDQAVEKIIAVTSADEATAQAIRDAVADVKNIIPDNVEETDVPAVQEPVDEPAAPVDETPVGATDQNPDGPVEGDVEEDAASDDPAPETPAPSDVPEGENPAVVEDEARTEE